MRARAPYWCVLATAAALAACGGAGPRATPTERRWIENGARLVDDLFGDVRVSAAGGSDIPSARRALGSDSDLYALVVAYTALGNCTGMLRNVGPPAPSLRDVARTIGAACARFERSAALFTRAVSGGDPGTLVAAGHAASLGFPFLVRAHARLAALSPGG